MYQEFADFEEQLHQFDVEINDMINKKDDNKKKPSPSSSDSDPKQEFAEIDKMLEQLKKRGEESQAAEKKSKEHISLMMQDIDDEFDEIDSLLRDVESLKIQDDINHREHQEESKQNAPTD